MEDLRREDQRRLRNLETARRVPASSAIVWPTEEVDRPFVTAAASTTTLAWESGPVMLTMQGVSVSFGLERVGSPTGGDLTVEIIGYGSGEVLGTLVVPAASVSPSFHGGSFPLTQFGQEYLIRLRAINANASTEWRIYKPRVRFVVEPTGDFS